VQVLKEHSRVLNGAQGALNSRGTQEALEEYSKATQNVAHAFKFTPARAADRHAAQSALRTTNGACSAERTAYANDAAN
jgi:hypothetical protein